MVASPVGSPIDVTHMVFNQPTPWEGQNLYSQDVPIQEAVTRCKGQWGNEILQDYGERLGSRETLAWGAAANENPPSLMNFDRFGHRIDKVTYHPAYHQLMSLAIEAGLPSLPWTQSKPGAHGIRAAMHYLHAQVEAGTCCPLTMTFASVPTLRAQPELARHWEPGLFARHYDPRDLPSHQKKGLTIGMAMTEKQGGSDVRSNRTTAEPLEQPGPGKAYRLLGHKWFCSAPMSDAFLVLAQSPGGLSCFLMPRWCPDGSRNPIRIQRLKDKLGNRANASSEIELPGSYAEMVGEEGRGVRTIIDMVALTRFDCMTGSTGLMRAALARAFHHVQYRAAFGKTLVDQPLMRNVLADLAIEWEAAIALGWRVAIALDQASRSPEARALTRITTAIGKFWVCKRAPWMISEAMECLGGAGYVEESTLPRLYKEAPVNSIWEGSGNVQCLDVLRAIQREPDSLQALQTCLQTSKGLHPSYDLKFSHLTGLLKDPSPFTARVAVAHMALLFQAHCLAESGNTAVCDAFIQSRLAADFGGVFGCLGTKIDTAPLLKRISPLV